MVRGDAAGSGLVDESASRPHNRPDLAALEDDELIHISLDGRLDAFNVLVARYDRWVLYIASDAGCVNDADDVRQTAFINAWGALDRFRGGSFKSWIATIARNACRDAHRRRAARPAHSLDVLVEETGEAHVPPSNEPGADQQVIERDLREQIDEALATLPEQFQRAVRLAVFEELRYREIVEITGWKMNTVKTRVSRGRRLLQQELERRGITYRTYEA